MLDRQEIFRPAALQRRQARMEAFLHHVEIGQHHEEQRPEGHEADEHDAEHRAVALEKALVGGIMGQLRFLARQQPEDGDDHQRNEKDEEPTHGPSSLPAEPAA